MNNPENYKVDFEQLQASGGNTGLAGIRQDAFQNFTKMGIPTARHEEWKYTRVGGLFNKTYEFSGERQPAPLSLKAIDPLRLPGFEQANELVFLNGNYMPSLSVVRSVSLVVLSLNEAASMKEYQSVIETHLGHSGQYLRDGINALNTALIRDGVFIQVKKGKTAEHPVYIYNITDGNAGNVFSQPRSLVHVSENARIQIAETYATIGNAESFTNQVMEVIMEKDAFTEYYKIQNDQPGASLVSSTHFRLVGKSHVHAVTVSLNGGIVRNNLNIIMEAAYCEAHLYGLYFQGGKSHIDNHTVVDNAKPNCLSNELYKGIMNDEASGVFNGKIFVRPQAQKTNAYQSNKNILLSDNASVNSKPQLEISADDVKCSHGCTIGQLDEEALFYLKSRGITEKSARALLVNAYATDILVHIKPSPIRAYIEQIISERLAFNIS